MTTADRHPAPLRLVRAEAERLGADPLFQAAAGASVLITGAAGMIGSCLALAFLEADRQQGLGLKVYGLSRNMDRARDLYAGLPLLPLSRDVAADPAGLPRFDYVVHAASPVGPALFAADPAGVVSANLAGTLNLLGKAARDGARRFLLVSTHEVYGTGRAVWREEDAGLLDFFSVRACYPESKRAGENACVCFHRQHGLATGVARLARVMGPTMNLASGLFVCDFLKDALAGRPIAIKGDGNLIRPLAYAADAAAGLVRILFSGAPGEAYNLAPAEAPTILDAARVLSELSGAGICEAAPGGPGGGAAQDIAKLRALGWEPRVAFRKGLELIWEAAAGRG